MELLIAIIVILAFLVFGISGFYLFRDELKDLPDQLLNIDADSLVTKAAFYSSGLNCKLVT